MIAGGFQQPLICKAVVQHTALFTGYWTLHHKGSVKVNGLYRKGSELKQTFSYGNLCMRCEEINPIEVFLLKQKYSENKQQTYNRTPKWKCDFNKIGNNLLSCKLVTFFQNIFS